MQKGEWLARSYFNFHLQYPVPLLFYFSGEKRRSLLLDTGLRSAIKWLPVALMNPLTDLSDIVFLIIVFLIAMCFTENNPNYHYLLRIHSERRTVAALVAFVELLSKSKNSQSIISVNGKWNGKCATIHVEILKMIKIKLRFLLFQEFSKHR